MLCGVSGLPGLTLHNIPITRRHLAATVLAHFFRENQHRFQSVAYFCGDLADPTILQDLESYCQSHHGALQSDLASTVSPEIQDALGLIDGRWFGGLFGPDSRLTDVIAAVRADYRRLGELEREASHSKDYDRAKWASARAKQIASEDVISFLSRSAVIPRYGFPVDVVELDLHERDGDPSARRVVLERDLSLAVAEFAPTCELVANKKLWRSVGVKLVPERPLVRYGYKICPQHDSFVAWKIDEQLEPELPCHCKVLPDGEFLSPKFGFVGDRRAREPVRRPTRLFSTRPRFLGLVRPHEQKGSTHGPIRFYPASPGQMAVVCEGRRGLGFYVCPRCGAGFSSMAKLADGHRDPFGRVCNTEVRHTSLGHVFPTDVLRLDFPSWPPEIERGGQDDLGFANSLAYALLEGSAECLDVPGTDMNVTVHAGLPGSFPGVILYDNVPGGAGLVGRLEDARVFRRSLEAARERTAGRCGCAPDTSCYGCLRSYRNQFAHLRLRRGPVAAYLDWLLGIWPGPD
jgi:hypothetical protein